MLGVAAFFISPAVVRSIKSSRKVVPVKVLRSTERVSAPIELQPRDIELTFKAPTAKQVNETMDSFDRIMDSLSKMGSTLVVLVGGLLAFREYKDHKKRKTAKS